MIDNQPQFSGTAAYHTPGALGGPNERSISLEYHSGWRNNINRLRRACRVTSSALGVCLQQQLVILAGHGLSTDKIVATASYTKRDSYSLLRLPLDSDVPGFQAIDLKSAIAYKVKVQGGRQLATQLGGKAVRADLSLEGTRNEDDPLRAKSRWVGTLTLSIPLGDNITVPVSLTYANRAEFLEEPDERLGAHFGLSYRLPNLLGGGSP